MLCTRPVKLSPVSSCSCNSVVHSTRIQLTRVQARKNKAQDAAPAATESSIPSTSDSTPSTSSPVEEAPQPLFVREYESNGVKVIESNTVLPGPENVPDFWEGENMDAFGKLVERYFLPGLVVLGFIAGGFAARTYDDGASVFVKAPNPEEQGLLLVPADPKQ